MELFRGLRALREDPDWLSKLVLSGLLAFAWWSAPLFGLLAFWVLDGWSVVALRRAVRSGAISPTPKLEFDLDYLTALLETGWKPSIALFFWTIPAVLVVGLGAAAIFAMGLATSTLGSETSSWALLLLTVAGGVGLAIFFALWALPSQAASMRVALTDDLKSAFEVSKVLTTTRLMGWDLFWGNLVTSLAMSALGMLATMACFLPVYFVPLVGLLVRAHLYAQLYERYLDRGGEPLTVAFAKADRMSEEPA
jgi:Protein of unknown function (DUF4013)